MSPDRRLPAIPHALRQLYERTWKLPRIHKQYASMSVAEAFSHIYRSKVWGGGSEEFFSGGGSQGRAAEEYCTLVEGVIRQHGVDSVADLGCGDFQVGRRLIAATHVTYEGVDVVPEVVEHHCRAFQTDRVHFSCRNIISDPLPSARLCLIRQVLQHLSNGQILGVLENVRRFPLVLISEHVPAEPTSFNRDKPQGPDARLTWGSGVYVDQPPFVRPVAQEWKTFLEEGSVLRTTLLVQP